MNINNPVSTLAGIGPKRAAALAAHDIHTVGDLLNFYPNRYLNRREQGSLDQPSEEAATVKVTVLKPGTLRRIQKNRTLFVLPVGEIQADGSMVKGEILWFNQPYLKGTFAVNETLWCYGKIMLKNGRRQMYNPQFCRRDRLKEFLRLVPVYPKVEGIPPASLVKYIHTALTASEALKDNLPEAYRRRFDLVTKHEALRLIHHPDTEEDVVRGMARIKFEEALKINMGILNNRTTGISTIQIEDFNVLERFIRGLPFELTGGQLSVLKDITQDLKKGCIMNRLVQGDVGSGKTIIAVACAFMLAINGYQTAYMAPTEILAEQHAANFANFLQPYGIEVALLTGSVKGKERNALIEAIEKGDAQVIIGTHALIQDSVNYYNLGLVITDEQHRFGVKQRGRLSLKGETPHTLVMSATPIPRTLSLILYGDLDVSYINELPKGRKKIKTYFYGEKALPKIYDFMAKEMDKGHQSFVICPFIEESEEMDGVRDIEHVYAEVTSYYQGRYRIGYLYSRMPSDAKKQVISAFNQGEIDQLVATSIIEVGIDVPNVTVMTIMSAERFGLSQLHQLRGRTGRGQFQSYCFLVSNNRSEQTIERMKVIVNHTDGRQIADADYKLRGPGDYFGARQHGFGNFQALNPYEDMAIIAKTRDIAREISESKAAELIQYRAEVLASFYADQSEISMN